MRPKVVNFAQHARPFDAPNSSSLLLQRAFGSSTSCFVAGTRMGRRVTSTSALSLLSRFFSKTGDTDMIGPVMRESEMLVLGELPC